MKYTTIIFDLDGTLLNTLADLAAATNHALAEHKLPQRTTDEVRRFVGNGIRKLIERAVPADTPAELQEEVFASFNKYYKQHCADSTRRIAEYCGITGYTATVSTACSSAANAVITGALLLENDMADYVVAGGTDALCRFTLNGFNSLSILDRERCRPFDATRAGLNLGEGAGYVVLAREEPGMRSYCRLAGYANANDAHHQTASSETGEGAYRAMAEALARSGLERVDYINAHGTATPNNDLTEGTALRRLFGELVPPFSSTKGFTGHALAAAGGIEAVLSALAIGHGLRYGNPGFAEPIPELGLRPVTETESAAVNSVLSNSFGFGGNCSSLIFAK